MRNERIIDRRFDSDHWVAERPAQRRKDLIRALTSLLSELQDPGGPRPLEERLTREEHEHWEDESYCYIEVKLGGRPISGIDVSLFDGRAFIRLER